MEKESIKILICDDSLLVRKQMKTVLSSNGYNNIIEALDGTGAVELFKESKPDVVFMDIVMPELSGVDALKEIMAYDSSARVVMVSSIGTQSNLKDAITLGAFSFLQKPFEEKMVLDIMQKIEKGAI